MATKPLVPDSVGPFKSLQAVFTRAWKWSRNHGMAFEDIHCVYRTKDGKNACLIGCCIPDSRMSPVLEGTVEGIKRHHPVLFAGIFPFVQNAQDLDVLSDLQNCHDNAAFNQNALDDPDNNQHRLNEAAPYHKSVTKLLRAFAKEHSLTVPQT